ncbi:MAG: hypothetical protein GXP34_09650 [Actinobacteria bacterium]|nr:hypothetical protein [Actinomycetota bacterium]
MYRRIAFLAMAALVVAACGGPAAEVPTSSVPSAEPTQTVSTSTTSTTAPAPTTTVSTELAPYIDALDRTLAVSAYRFEATIQAQTQSGLVSVDLSGWVNGTDRELVTRSGGQEMTTTVKDGVATVTTPSGTTEVPLGEAADAPSLLLLRDLEGATVTGDGEVSGTLKGAVLQGSGLSDASAAGTLTDATITFQPGGDLTGYTLVDGARTWKMTVRIYDVGQVDG